MIKNADQKGLVDIARELTELSGKARDGKLMPGDMQGASFTISSLGGIGGTSFTPIINAPEVAILGVTRSAMKPVWDGREFVPRLMVPLSLSYDHRVIDGAAAARFMVYLVRSSAICSGAAVTEIRVPDIGDFTDVPVIEIHVSPGDEVALEDPLVTLESDKATMDVPAPEAGTVEQLRVKIGDRVSEGSVLLTLESDGAAPSDSGSEAPAEVFRARPTQRRQREPAPPPPASSNGAGGDHDAQVVVIGSGPGGYTAAFRAADLGLKTVLIERHDTLGGVCLNVGCIPSKALLHAARVIAEAEEMAEHGITFGKPKVDLDELRAWKASVVGKLTGGLDGMAKQRKVEVVTGVASLTGPNAVQVGDRAITFDNCIIAAGSQAASIPAIPDDPRIVASTGALELPPIPKRLLVIGGGIIGLEMATVYDALGSKVTMVELLDRLIPGCDPDLVKPLTEAHRRALRGDPPRHAGRGGRGHGERPQGDAVRRGGEAQFDRVLVAVGAGPTARSRRRRGRRHGDERGFIEVDSRCARTSRTSSRSATSAAADARPQGLARGQRRGRSHRRRHGVDSTPGRSSVAYTDPEVAWMGMTETRPRPRDQVREGRVPVGRLRAGAIAGRDEGVTKLLFEPGRSRCSAPASSASTRASSSPRPCSRSRWAPTPKTSR